MSIVSAPLLTPLDQRDDMALAQVQLHNLDHIPPKTLERMALGLLDNKADARTLNMYKVVVHFKAALSLYVGIP